MRSEQARYQKGRRQCLRPFCPLTPLRDSGRDLALAGSRGGERPSGLPRDYQCLYFKHSYIHSASVPGADVRASLDVPAGPAVAAAHGLELLVRKLASRLLGKIKQVLGVEAFRSFSWNSGVLKPSEFMSHLLRSFLWYCL